MIPIPGLETDAKGLGENRLPAEYAHHLFISYARQPDRPLAKRIESFLEGFHRTLRMPHPEAGASQAPEPLRVCVDGSDFVLPAPDATGAVRSRDIDAVICEHLAQCRELLVLCSERAAASAFVEREVAWFLEHRGEAYVRVALTEGNDPLLEPERYFPRALVERGFAKRACYDLRGFRQREAKTWNRVDELDREMVRLAGDLLGKPAGTLFPTWLREQQLRRARNRWAWGTVAASIVALTLFAYSQYESSGKERALRQAAQAEEEAQRERAKAEKQRADLRQLEAEMARKERQQEAERRKLAEEREQTEQALRRAAQAFETLYRDPYEALHLADLSRSQRRLPEAERALESAFRSAVSRAENRRDYTALTGSGPGYLARRWRQGDVYSYVSPDGRHVLLVTKRAPDGAHTEDGKEMAGDVYLLDQETLRVRELSSCDPSDRGRVEYAGFDASGQRVLLTRYFHFQAYSLDGACQGKVNFSEHTKSPIHLVGGYVLGRFVIGADSKGGIWYREPDGKSRGEIRPEWPRERDPAIAFAIRPDGRAATIVFESGKAVEVLFEAAGKHKERLLRKTGVLCAVYQPGGETLALGDESGRVHLFKRGVEVHGSSVASSAIEELAFADQGHRLIAVSADPGVVLLSVESGAAKPVRSSMGEYEKWVRRVPVPRVRHFRALADQLGQPMAREAIQTAIVKTEEAGGRTFLFTQAENRFYPEVAYVSEGTQFRALDNEEDPVIQVHEYLGRAWLATEQGRLLELDEDWTQSRLPHKARFLRARVIDGSLWVGTTAGLYVLEGVNANQLISAEAAILDIVPAGQKVWIATNRGAYLRDEDGQFYRVTESFRNIRSIQMIGDFVWMLTGTESEPGPALVGAGLRFRPVPGRASRVTGLVEENGDVLLATPAGTLRFRDGELRGN